MTGTVTGECDRDCNYVVNVIGTVTVQEFATADLVLFTTSSTKFYMPV